MSKARLAILMVAIITAGGGGILISSDDTQAIGGQQYGEILAFESTPSDGIIVPPGYHAVTFIDSNGSVSYRTVVHGGMVDDVPEKVNEDNAWSTFVDGTKYGLSDYGPIFSDVVFKEGNRNHSGGSNRS